MGRHSTGITTINEVFRIDISYLRRNGGIVPGKCINGSLGWSNGESVLFESNLEDKSPNINLSYEGTEKDCRIHLATVPSNLQKGEIYYFICPVNLSLCRKLYKCTKSELWQSRTAFENRLYYSYQLSSKYNYSNDRYWAVEKQLKELYPQVVKSHYRGHITRLQQRIKRLEDKKEYYNHLRWTKIPKSIEKMFKERKKVV